MSRVQCSAVPSNALAHLWPLLFGFLGPAIKTGEDRIGPEDVFAGARSGVYVIWLVLIEGVPVAAFTSRVCTYPRCRVMVIDWVGGSRIREWLAPAMRVMKEHAKLNDCASLEAYGREAWGRLVRRENWKAGAVTFRLELGDGNLS